MKALRIWLQGQWAATSRSGWFVLWPPHTVTVYDGHTLKDALGQVQRIAGENPEQAFVDMGYRRHGYSGEVEVHVDPNVA